MGGRERKKWCRPSWTQEAGVEGIRIHSSTAEEVEVVVAVTPLVESALAFPLSPYGREWVVPSSWWRVPGRK